MLTIVHCTRDIDQSSGGPARSVPALAAAQVEQGPDRAIILADNSSLPILPNHKSERLRVELLNTGWCDFLDRDSWTKESRETLVVHVHGLWSSKSQRVARWAIRKRIPLIISPRGMLAAEAFKHKKLKKIIGWSLFQKRILNEASLIHATASSELDSIRQFNIETPVIVLPNGVNLNQLVMRSTNIAKAKRTVAFLGRLHPIKNLVALIKAWNLVNHDGWNLVLAGMDEDGHQRVLEQTVDDLSLRDSVSFSGRIEGQAKSELFVQSDLFVLPSLSENFGISVIEALSCGVPVIATRGTPWSDLEKYNCGWWVEPSVEGLASALRRAMAESDETRHKMGQHGRNLVEKQYLWPPIARQMLDAYQWTLNRSGRPEWLHSPSQNVE